MFHPVSWFQGGFTGMISVSNPVDSLCQGVVAACGISVLCNLMRVYYFTQTCTDADNLCKQRSSSPSSPLRRNWISVVQFWISAVLLSLVGTRISSLIVLEFSLRAVSAWASAGLGGDGRGLALLLFQCQFSLGCSLSCTLSFLHQGAPHSTLSLFLAAGLSWALASCSHSLWNHVAKLYLLHSTKCYCGKCLTLLTSGHTLLASLQKVVILTFAFATVASISTVYDHFLSQKDALKFWILLTLCYTMLLVYIQEDQHRQTGAESLLHTVVLRLGALLVLMLAMGHWSDVLHVLITFLGEAVCLLPSQDLLQAVLKEEEDTKLSQNEQTRYRKREHTTKTISVS